MKEKINILYIDDDRDEAISEYLDDFYRNEQYDIIYQEVEFDRQKGYEGLLDNKIVATANIILIDSKLFENDSVNDSGKFSGEEFRMILRKIYPFIEVLVISQNGENETYDIIPKYRSGTSESSEDYYNRVLKNKIDDGIKRVITFRNISRKLENNKDIEKLLVEKAMDSLNGVDGYNDLSKIDIDHLIDAFKSIK